MIESARQLEWAENVATAEQITEHLNSCVPIFVAKLCRHVDLDNYSHKLFEKATRFEAWDKQTLVGLVAAYLNGTVDSSIGFVTNVSVLESHTGIGIASRLLQACSERAIEAGLSELRLEVDRENAAALSLYRKMGYVVLDDANEIIIMQRPCDITK